MQPLSSQTIINLWESGLRQQHIERSLLLLAAALPEVSRRELLALSIGQCDAYLLLLHERTFGARFDGFAECSQCRERLEFSFNLDNIWAGAAPTEDVGKAFTYQIDDYEMQIRLPTTGDMFAMRECQHVSDARALLLQRCIASVTRNQDEISVERLPDTVIMTLGERLLERDPQMEIQIDMVCPQCQHRWSALFDITTFLWTAIHRQAQRLLREVHTLARAYGWHEAEILALSNARRQYYIEMVSE